jgi:hypothetical protein
MIRKIFSLITKTLHKMVALGLRSPFSTQKPVETPPPLENHTKNPQISANIGKNQFIRRVYGSTNLSAGNYFHSLRSRFVFNPDHIHKTSLLRRTGDFPPEFFMCK